MHAAKAVMGVVLAITSLAISAQQVLPQPLVGGAPTEVPVAVQILRWQMLDNSVSSLMFRSMDTLFTTRTVARGGPVWNLPRADQPLKFSYGWPLKTYPGDRIQNFQFQIGSVF